MTIALPSESYDYPAKQAWRNWVHNSLFEMSYNVLNDKLIGKWLEPVGYQAKSFSQLLEANIIAEENLIGLDYNPKDPEVSRQNMEECSKLFPKASFNHELWSTFCHGYAGNDLNYIIYDLYTSTHGAELEKNLKATCELIRNCLKYTDQVILVVNADLKICRRQRKNEIALKHSLEKIIKNYRIPMPLIDMDSIYTYQNTASSDEMGSLILNFH